METPMEASHPPMEALMETPTEASHPSMEALMETPMEASRQLMEVPTDLLMVPILPNKVITLLETLMVITLLHMGIAHIDNYVQAM